MHLNDDLEGVKNELQQAIKDYDVLLLSGGVSKGKLDFIPQAMEDLGIVKAPFQVIPFLPFCACTSISFPGIKNLWGLN